ncbi:hypothetical protein BDZ45DRAFT_809789 [Acephala macrosclerotiorum]|nr:hypothetical protein BDZ45DRAFT_809789 [Acephala macrosclerotiorum]
MAQPELMSRKALSPSIRRIVLELSIKFISSKMSTPRKQKISLNSLNAHGIFYDIAVVDDDAAEALPAHVNIVREGVLDFDAFLIRDVANGHRYDDIPKSAYRDDDNMEKWEHKKLRYFIDTAKNLSDGAQRLRDDLCLEPKWQHLFCNTVFKERNDAVPRREPLSNSFPRFSISSMTHIACTSDGEELWDEAHSIRRLNVLRTPLPTIPKPDIYCGFPVYDSQRYNTYGFWKDDFIQNFTVETLSHLRENGMSSTATSAVAKRLAEKMKPGKAGELIPPHHLLCFPFAVIELKRHKQRNNNELATEVYRQAANASSTALCMMENLAKFAEITKNSQHIPPIVVVTCVGGDTKVWLAYSCPSSNNQRDHQMKCIWEGSLCKIWDAIQFCRIIDNISSWAQFILRPKVSQYIDQWRARHLSGPLPGVHNLRLRLEQEPDLLPVVHLIERQLNSLNISSSSELPELVRLILTVKGVLLSATQKVTHSREEQEEIASSSSQSTFVQGNTSHQTVSSTVVENRRLFISPSSESGLTTSPSNKPPPGVQKATQTTQAPDDEDDGDDEELSNETVITKRNDNHDSHASSAPKWHPSNHDNYNRLKAELESAKDQNRALTLYTNKIIERLLQHPGANAILNQSSDFGPGVAANTDKVLPPSPPLKEQASEVSIFQRPPSTSVTVEPKLHGTIPPSPLFGSLTTSSNKPVTVSTSPSFETSTKSISGFESSKASGRPGEECRGTRSFPLLWYTEKDQADPTLQNCFQSLNSISEYQNFSLEELRLADYQQGRRFFSFNTPGRLSPSNPRGERPPGELDASRTRIKSSFFASGATLGELPEKREDDNRQLDDRKFLNYGTRVPFKGFRYPNYLTENDKVLNGSPIMVRLPPITLNPQTSGVKSMGVSSQLGQQRSASLKNGKENEPKVVEKANPSTNSDGKLYHPARENVEFDDDNLDWEDIECDEISEAQRRQTKRHGTLKAVDTLAERVDQRQFCGYAVRPKKREFRETITQKYPRTFDIDSTALFLNLSAVATLAWWRSFYQRYLASYTTVTRLRD